MQVNKLLDLVGDGHGILIIRGNPIAISIANSSLMGTISLGGHMSRLLIFATVICKMPQDKNDDDGRPRLAGLPLCDGG